MLVWGRAEDGQLGLGGIEETIVSSPTRCKHLDGHRIREVECGRSHMVALTESGELWSCGSNNSGQLGQDVSTTKPAVISLAAKVVRVSCGHAHSIALTEGGDVFAWGDNGFGQLGHSSTDFSPQSSPVLVKDMSGSPQVVQVACGANHTMALLRDGRLFSWGINDSGQLGHSAGTKFVAKVTRIMKADGLPIVHIAAGGDQSFVLSLSGAVYGWGRNDFGQLGIGHVRNTGDPTELTTLRTQRVKYIACGENHTAVLTEDGGVFTFGSSQYGQLGHNSTQPSSYPKKVFELMGSVVSQITCGRCHTLALVKTSGRLFSFGLGSNGQLGTKGTGNRSTPTPVYGVWLAPSEVPMEVDGPAVGTSVDQGYVVRRIFAGGDHSYASVLLPGESSGLPVYDCRVTSSTCIPYFLDHDGVKEALDRALITKDYTEIVQILTMVSSFASCLNGAFLTRDHHKTSENYSGVDLKTAVATFQLLDNRLKGTPEEGKLQQLLRTNLFPILPHRPVSIECVRLFYVTPACIFVNPKMEVMVAYLKAFLMMEPQMRRIVGNWLFAGPEDYIHQWLSTLKDLLTILLVKSKDLMAEQDKYPIGTKHVMFQALETDMMRYGLEFVKTIRDWNSHHGDVIPHDEFHLSLVSEVVDLVADYFNWIEKKSDVLIFCEYPFVLDAQAKAELIKVESKFHQHLAVTHAQRQMVHSLFTNRTFNMPTLAFQLTVRRDHLLTDTLRQLTQVDERNLKKPLHVRFVGEEGLDAGGVQKEFFMLLIQDILNPDFGMFVEDSESHLLWFRDQAIHYERLEHFVLVGILCGLAIYNTVIVDLPFPLALYKKLLDRPPNLTDLTELRPSVGHNLQALLDYEGDDFDEMFELTFEISRTSFGTTESVELVPGGSKIPVTKDLRQDYVQAYVKYVLSMSVKDPYDAFASGFLRVCGGDVLNLFHPKELMSLVVGIQADDWTELEKYVQYRNGYTADHPTIKLFWKVFYELPVETKKKFLVFLTGSNRIPVAGVKSMKMMIQKMDGGPGCERLPVAHTCFNVLDLPPYPTEAQMKQKLLQCIHFTSGFGII